MNHIATPIALIVGITGGLVFYFTSQSTILGITVWVGATGLASLALDIIESRRPECRAALTAVRSCHPDWRAWTASGSVRAVESDRFVVAVFYIAPDVDVRPPRYVLVALNRDLQFLELLPVSPDSPYYVRGRK